MKYGEESERKALSSLMAEEGSEIETEEPKERKDPMALLSKIQRELDELSELL